MKPLREYKNEVKSKYGRTWKVHWSEIFNKLVMNKQLVTIDGIVYVKE